MKGFWLYRVRPCWDHGEDFLGSTSGERPKWPNLLSRPWNSTIVGSHHQAVNERGRMTANCVRCFDGAEWGGWLGDIGVEESLGEDRSRGRAP